MLYKSFRGKGALLLQQPPVHLWDLYQYTNLTNNEILLFAAIYSKTSEYVYIGALITPKWCAKFVIVIIIGSPFSYEKSVLFKIFIMNHFYFIPNTYLRHKKQIRICCCVDLKETYPLSRSSVFLLDVPTLLHHLPRDLISPLLSEGDAYRSFIFRFIVRHPDGGSFIFRHPLEA